MTHKQKRQFAKISAIARQLVLGIVPERIEYSVSHGHCGRWIEAVEPHEIRAAMRREHPYGEGGSVRQAYDIECDKHDRRQVLETAAMEALAARYEREEGHSDDVHLRD